jgi:hypothetical protein
MKGIMHKQDGIYVNPRRKDCILSLNPPGVKEKKDHQVQERPGKTC